MLASLTWPDRIPPFAGGGIRSGHVRLYASRACNTLSPASLSPKISLHVYDHSVSKHQYCKVKLLYILWIFQHGCIPIISVDDYIIDTGRD